MSAKHGEWSCQENALGGHQRSGGLALGDAGGSLHDGCCCGGCVDCQVRFPSLQAQREKG